MNKVQFIEILSGFIAPRLVDALAEQAEGKGYFEEVKNGGRTVGDLKKQYPYFAERDGMNTTSNIGGRNHRKINVNVTAPKAEASEQCKAKINPQKAKDIIQKCGIPKQVLFDDGKKFVIKLSYRRTFSNSKK